jgi:hypothetical protein
LEAKLAEQDTKIAELAQYVKHLENVSDNRLQLLQELEFELMGARCEAGDVGDDFEQASPRHWDEEIDASSDDESDTDVKPESAYWEEDPTDGGPMTLDELNVSSWQEDPTDGGPMTLDELTLDDEHEASSSGDEVQLVRLTPGNVSQYIGHEIMFRSRNRQVVTRIISVSSGLKTIKIDHPDLQNNLEIVSRKVYVIV